jgi:hypothetical protein
MPELRQSALFVSTDQPTVAGDISRQDRDQSPLNALLGQGNLLPPAWGNLVIGCQQS